MFGTIKKTMHIEGMKCPHCEAHAKEALEALDGVKSAKVSHVNGTAVVSMKTEISDADLTAAIVGAGYKVTSID